MSHFPVNLPVSRELSLGDAFAPRIGHRKRCANGASDDSNFTNAVEVECVKFGVITGPARVRAGGPRSLQMANDVGVWVEHADFWHVGDQQSPLAGGFP